MEVISTEPIERIAVMKSIQREQRIHHVLNSRTADFNHDVTVMTPVA